MLGNLFKSEHEKNVEAHQRVIDFHFGEMIDWNIQTSMYQMLFELINRMDPKYLSEITKVLNLNGNVNDIDVQLRDAIIDVLKHKKLISEDFKVSNNNLDKKIKIFKIKETIISLDSSEYLNPHPMESFVEQFNLKEELNAKDILELKFLHTKDKKNYYFIKYI